MTVSKLTGTGKAGLHAQQAAKDKESTGGLSGASVDESEPRRVWVALAEVGGMRGVGKVAHPQGKKRNGRVLMNKMRSCDCILIVIVTQGA